MTKTTKTETQSKNALINLVKSLLPGKHNTIPLSLPVVQALGGDLESAIIFSQCMYWSERTEDPDGYFYKCYDEWYEETTIKERTCRDRIKKLEARGWIHTLIMHVHNVPKLHIKVLPENFIEDLIESQEEIAKETEKRAEKKKIDLRNRREKRKESSNPYTSTIRQNLPDSGGNSCRITAAEFAGSIDTETTTRNYITETTEYTQSIGNADSTFELTGNFSRSGSKPIDSTANGTASPGNNSNNCGASENDYHSQNEPYAKPWHKDEPLRVDKNGYAVLPPANKHKMPRQTAVKLAQYVLLAENDPNFELMLPDPSDCLDGEYPTDCWVTSKNNCTWYRENELETTEPLRALRNVNEANGGLDFNELLNDCWRAATSLWDEDDALALFKRTPLPVIFEDFLEDYGVEVIEYDFDILCPL